LSGIVHRDIKPSNIYILPGEIVKILDFGIAKLFGEGGGSTKTGIQIGTPVYMSPEQVKGDKSIDHRSDIYSLGVTLYSACNGKPPYDKNTLSDFAIYNKIVTEPLPTLSNNSVFTNLINKACQKDREYRYQTCLEFLDQLKFTENVPDIEQDIFEIPETPQLPDSTPDLPVSTFSVFFKPLLVVAGVILVILLFGKIFFTDSNEVPNAAVQLEELADANIAPADTAVPAFETLGEYSGDSVTIYSEMEVDEPPTSPSSFVYNNKLHEEMDAPESTYTVSVSFDINEIGEVYNIRFGTDHGYGLEGEIESSLRNSSGRWTPATKRRQRVKCSLQRYFTFGDPATE
jgi:serine/threonine protein kinase